jgi:hypothetical protein
MSQGIFEVRVDVFVVGAVGGSGEAGWSAEHVLIGIAIIWYVDCVVMYDGFLSSRRVWPLSFPGWC